MRLRLTKLERVNIDSRVCTSLIRMNIRVSIVGLLLYCQPAVALYVSADLEVLRIAYVGASWKSVTTQNTYSSEAVVVCVYSLPSSTDNEAAVRLRNIGGAGFDVRIQKPENGSSVTASDVYCLVSEEGAYTLPDGLGYEAHKTLSNGTNGTSRGWGVGGANGAEDVSNDITGSYPNNSQPRVLGQVMTYNDTEFSTFWSFDCDDRRNVPFQSNVVDGICVGKQVGQIRRASGNRANEDLGYFVIEEDINPGGSFDGISYRVDLGADSIRGVGSSPPYVYSLGTTYEFAVTTQEAMNGPHGGWAVLYGSEPLALSNLDLAIDEETVEGDTSRAHATEQAAYWAFHGVDHGDATASYGDAAHNVSGILSIGPTSEGDADAESGAQFSTLADGDDIGLLDDEDGVTFRSPAGTGKSIFADVEITNNTGGTVNVCGWLDVPSGGIVDGAFDPSDGQCQTTNTVNPTIIFQWPGLPVDQQYATYARFRVSTDSMGTGDGTGLLADGEVEDYRVQFDFSSTSVTINEVSLVSVSVADYLNTLDNPNDEQLLELLETWDPDAASSLEGESHLVILAALAELLDPDGDDQFAMLSWDTLEERGTIGFYVDRESLDGTRVRINSEMLPGLITAPLGGEYLLADPSAQSGQIYFYYLTEQEAWGTVRHYGPFELEMN